MQAAVCNVDVILHVRPLSESELLDGCHPVLRCADPEATQVSTHMPSCKARPLCMLQAWNSWCPHRNHTALLQPSLQVAVDIQLLQNQFQFDKVSRGRGSVAVRCLLVLCVLEPILLHVLAAVCTSLLGPPPITPHQVFSRTIEGAADPQVVVRARGQL